MRLNTILKINAKMSGNYPYSRHPCIFQDATRRPQKPAFEFVAKGSEKKGTTKAPRHKVFRACPSCVGKQKSFLCAFVPLCLCGSRLLCFLQQPLIPGAAVGWYCKTIHLFSTIFFRNPNTPYIRNDRLGLNDRHNA